MPRNLAEPDTSVPAENFEAIETAVLESRRGRWFLAEYARRQHSAETATLLAAIARLEHAVAHPQTEHGVARRLEAACREIAGRSDALRKIAEGAGLELGQRLESEADALRVLALGHDLLRQRLEASDIVEASRPEPGLTSTQLKFFAGDEDLFEAANELAAVEPAELAPNEQPAVAPVLEPEPPSLPPLQPTSEAVPKNRIVIIRYPAGEPPVIPLQGELAPTG